MTTLFVSPHLDDVALSCAGRLMDAQERGERVVVATVFTEGSPKYRVRRAEDRAALSSLGVQVRHLGLLDAPYRLGCGFDALALLSAPSDEDVAAVVTALSGVLREVEADEVWFPAGVGGHVDHRAVFAARGAVVGARLYVERPYAFKLEAVVERLNAIEHRVEEVHWPRAWLPRVVALVEAYRSQARWLFADGNVEAAYARHAVRDGQLFELWASSDST